MNTALMLSDWANIIITFLGVLLFAWLSFKEDKKNKKLYTILLIINLWSFIVYTFFILPKANILNLNNNIKYIYQYIEWIVTTPLELILLMYLATYRSKANTKTLVALITLDIIAILFAPLADYSANYRYLLYGIGFIPMAAIMWYIWIKLRLIAKSSGPELYKLYVITAAYLTFFWALYPAAWLSGPLGLNIISNKSVLIIFHILNLFTKTGYSLLYLRNVSMLKNKK